jgi:hypothetical protein
VEAAVIIGDGSMLRPYAINTSYTYLRCYCPLDKSGKCDRF